MTEHTNQNQNADQAAALDERAAAEAGETSLEHQLAEARAEAGDMRDKFLRARADMENFRKRMERTYAEQSRAHTKTLLTKLLSVKDNLERALQYGPGGEAGESVVEGVRLTLYQLDSVLAGEGVKAIDAEGQPFDPRLEEAVHSVHDPNVEDQTVVQVVRRGYTLGDDVLRPAQVVVSVHANT